jgi:hypothetical protein
MELIHLKTKRNKYLNQLLINGQYYDLPNEPNKLVSVLNHLEMVDKGKKTHINLYVGDNKISVSRIYIQTYGWKFLPRQINFFSRLKNLIRPI